MRIRRRPPPLPTAPPIDDPPQLPLSDPPPSLSAALYVDLLAPPPALPPFPLSASSTPPAFSQFVMPSSFPFTSSSPLLQTSQHFPPPRLQLRPNSQSPPLLHEIEEPGSADQNRRTPLSERRAAAVAGNTLEGRCDSAVQVEERCEKISKLSTVIPSAIDRTFAEVGENNETRMPIRKRRSFTRPRGTRLPPSGTDGELQGSKAKRLIALNELNRIGTWGAKDLLSWALQLIVPEEGSRGVPGRMAENGYSKSSKTDSIPRLVQVGPAWRCNSHIQDLVENVRCVVDQEREEILMKGGKWDHDTHADRHITGQKQENKVSFDENFVEERMSKRVIFSKQDEGTGSRTTGYGMEVGLKEAPTKCSREDGIIDWQLAEKGGKDCKKLCEHQDFELARDGEAKSSEETMKMMKKKKKKKKRRCFKSLHEIVRRDEKRQLFHRRAQEQYDGHSYREKLSGSVSAVASDGGFWHGSTSFQACVLNSNPTEWRSDLF